MDPLTILATLGGGVGGGLIRAGGSRALGASAGALGSGLGVHHALQRDEKNQEYNKKDRFGHDTVKDKMQEAKDLAAPYIREWSESGGEDGSEWLGMIDAAYLNRDKIAKDKELESAFSQMLEAHGVNALDVSLKHHNQKRRYAGLGDLAMPAD
tara:strand:- start:71 stop:532 length:462 start_codon:yes stop_codon:yes gene_type:complete